MVTQLSLIQLTDIQLALNFTIFTHFQSIQINSRTKGLGDLETSIQKCNHA